jgi:hypothetical protein
MSEVILAKGRCVHCLCVVNSIEADHVFPNSWYPDTTPPTVQRWKAPSCPRCNRNLGQLEKDLFVRLILCIDPKSEAVSGLKERVLRSLGLDTDQLSEKEKEHRDNLRARIRSELISSADVEGKPEARVPGLGPYDSAEWAVPLPWASLSIVAEKIVRGCEYNLAGRYVELPYGVRTFIRDTADVPEPFASFGQILDFGPGFRIIRVFATEDPSVVRYWMSLWGTLHLTVFIDLEDHLLTIDPISRRCEGIVPPENRGMQISPYLRNVNQQESGER